MGSTGYKKTHKEKSKFFDAYKSIKAMFELMQLYKNFNNISFKAFLISTNTIPKFMDIIKKSHILYYLNNDKNNLKYPEDNLNDLLSSYSKEDNIKILYDYNELKKISKKNDEKENEFIIVDELFCRTMNIKEYFYEHNKLNITINKSIMIINSDDYSDDFYFTQKENGIYKFINRSNE